MADNNKMLMYKGHPLRRKDNLIYYGSMADKYIVMIQVMSTTKDGGLEIADKVHLFSAIDMGATWLMRALAGK